MVLLKKVFDKVTQARLAMAYNMNRFGHRIVHRARKTVRRCLYVSEEDRYSSGLVTLHKKIDIELRRQKKEYKSLRYAYGYPYQGLATLGVIGARSTEDRWDAYGLQAYVTSQDTILDVGANCGFMSLYSVFRTGCRADCIDINPYMLNIGRHCADLLRLDGHMGFIEGDFNDMEIECKYSLVFSFAAHQTEDGQHCPTLRNYFERVHKLLRAGGHLVFETHGYDADNAEFQQSIMSIGDMFALEEKRSLFHGKRELYYFGKIER
jgi:SAM-dependent methyltransferase